jgi:hypothetical protein
MQRTCHGSLQQPLKPGGVAVLQALRRFEISPQDCQSSMQDDTAIAWAQAFLRILDSTCTQPVRHKGPKRTSGLVLQDPRTARYVHITLERNSRPVDGLIEPRSTLHFHAPVTRTFQSELLWHRARKTGEQRTCRQHPIVRRAMPAKYDFRGRALPAGLHASRETELPVSRAARDTATALQVDGQQRIGPWQTRPRFVREAKHP